MRRAGLVLSGVAASVMLVGCGGGNGAPQAEAPKPRTAETVEALSAGFKQATQGKNSARMRFEMAAGDEKMSGDCSVAFGASAEAMDCQVESVEKGTPEKMRMLAKDKVVYVKGPDELEPGKSWLKLDTRSNNPLAAMMGKAFDSVSQVTDFEKSLPKGAKILKTEQEKRDGQDLTRYEVEFDPKVLRANAKDRMEKLGALALQKAGVGAFHTTFWVNAENLPVRFEMTVPAPKTADKPMEAKFSGTYTDWGKPVEVTVPPAEQVAEFPEIPGFQEAYEKQMAEIDKKITELERELDKSGK
ncbi:hypothetical protein LX15_004123 [Streptoalloteichus tenebrarius]|uniref:Lipoprotein n=1 Tax=Streptoalloteichus tenebrarius (strain ATCC 17920 / DSM 40477 / JCM 4838 / CBS 697.72 / NBRC 16177 / NCIMB 11028 / NRRL B-12390 / A12253. 1 / ISP 5477) TaxID=1933 RepID=A0ABT1HY24_STRSD|nr:hypothetical protein [Streptoalloteichus tenebrarius]MCP2260409.1 hypothetical protein [Streptoalloteichus tenebrarius]BFF02483.1 hypothetical protein GCM10020241_41580 [Streptoalloteichus tenebrarius]